MTDGNGNTISYHYDGNGVVPSGMTDGDGYTTSYAYDAMNRMLTETDAFGNATFGYPQYDNEYTFNGESYNPNIHSQYLRARYYDMVKGSFLTEDSYLGDIRSPLTLNRYSYCIGNSLFYVDPSGHHIDLSRTPSSNPASLYNRIDFEARREWLDDTIAKVKKFGSEIKQGCYNYDAGYSAG